MERTNQELKQYLRMYVNYRQRNWSEWLATIEFAFNKVHIATKSLPFKVNYERELRMGFDIREKGKYMKAGKFAKEMKDRYKEVKIALVKS